MPLNLPSRDRRRGATLILYTMLLSLLILPVVGLSIDLARVYSVQGRLQTAVDAAAMGATRLLSTDANTSEIVGEFLKADYPPGFWSSTTPVVNSVNVTTTTNQTPNVSTVTVKASVTMPLIFLGYMFSTSSSMAMNATGTRNVYSLENCTLAYPYGNAPALTSVVFNEAIDLVGYGPTFVYPHGKIMAWYDDEHSLTLGVRQVNVITEDGTAQLTVTFSGSTNGNVGTPFSGTLSATGGTAPYTFSISAGTLVAGLTLNSSTGVISGQPTAQTSGPSGNVTAMVTDSLGARATTNVNLNISAAASLGLSFPGGANGNVGTPYSATPDASGGTGPYSFSVSAGSLPAGLSLNSSTGVISGTPTATVSGPAGNITLMVTDALGHTATGNGTINISAANPLQISFPGGTNGTVGTTFTATITATGGYAPYTFSISAGALPAGLTLNSSTGVISGTPTGVDSGSTANVTAMVTDSHSSTATQNGTVNIVAAASGSGSASGPVSGSGSGTKLTTTTNYTVAPFNSSTLNAVNLDGPLQVGTTALSGAQAGTDTATWNNQYGYLDNGRPLWPALFITDITTTPTSTSGDWQMGGTTAVPPNAVYGTWKAAVRTVDETTSPYTITVTPDADTNQNNWAGVPDAPPGGFPSSQGWDAEVVWFIDNLGLRPGRTYRLQFMIHDGDQNGTGGDVGEGCSIAIY